MDAGPASRGDGGAGSGTQRLALGAVLTLAFFALALKLCAAMEGAAVIALVGAGCAALLLAGAWRAPGRSR